MLTSVRLLDSFCYTNVFVDEGREALGVKIDKKTPKVCVCEREQERERDRERERERERERACARAREYM